MASLGQSDLVGIVPGEDGTYRIFGGQVPYPDESSHRLPVGTVPIEGPLGNALVDLTEAFAYLALPSSEGMNFGLSHPQTPVPHRSVQAFSATERDFVLAVLAGHYLIELQSDESRTWTRLDPQNLPPLDSLVGREIAGIYPDGPRILLLSGFVESFSDVSQEPPDQPKPYLHVSTPTVHPRLGGELHSLETRSLLAPDQFAILHVADPATTP